MTEPTPHLEPPAKFQRALEPGELEELNRLRAWQEHQQREAQERQLQEQHQAHALAEQQRRLAEQQHQLYQQQHMAEQHRQMYPGPPPQQFAPVQQVIVNNSVQTQSAFPHTMHLILTLVTCGAWLPVWIIHAIIAAIKN